jgi:CHAT domain-containing protein
MLVSWHTATYSVLIDSVLKVLTWFFLLSANQVGTDFQWLEHLVEQGHLETATDEILTIQSANKLNESDQVKLVSLQGDIAFYRAEFKVAQLYYQQALILAQSMNNSISQAEQMKNIAITFSEQSQYGHALKWHELALVALKQVNENDTKAIKIKLSILLSKGAIFTYVGAMELASETLAEAQNLAYQQQDLSALNNAYLRLAAMYYENQRHALSLDTLSLINQQAISDLSDQAWFYGLKLNVLIALQEWYQAEHLIEELSLSVEPWTDEFRHTILVLQAHLALEQGLLEEASQTIETLNNSATYQNSWIVDELSATWHLKNLDAIQALKHLRQGITKVKSHNSINKVHNDLFSLAINTSLLTTKRNQEELFDWLQWVVLSRQTIQHNHDPIIANLSVDEAKNEVADDVITGSYFKSIAHIKLSHLQQVLKQKEAVLIFLRIDDGLIAALISHNEMRWGRIHTNYPQIAEQIVKFVNHIKQQGDTWQTTALKLQSILLNPLRDWGLDNFSHLHIIPDDNLRFMPFELLLDEQGMMLIDRFQLVHNSFKGLAQMIQHRQSVPDRNNSETRLSFIGTNNNLPNIPNYWRTAYRNLQFSTRNYQGIQQELSLMKSFKMPGQIYFNEAATESVALETIRDETGILHFSSHGFDNPVAPAFSSLVLNADKNTDGLLQAREVMQNKSKLSLIVLASCSSAKGGLKGRYGNQLGLADAFVHSGVQAVIGTLWDVKDQSTAQFMQWFYEALGQTHVPAIALRETKLKARNAGWSAHDWSAFVMLGDNSTVVTMKPIELHKNSLFVVKLLGIALAVLLVTLILRKLLKH